MENSNVANSSMDDIVFEDRNKSYGAYQLRKDYTKNFGIAMVGASIFVALIIFSPDIYGFVSNLFGAKDKIEDDKMEVVEVMMEDIPLDPETPPPPVVEIPPPQVEMIRFLPPEIKPDNEVKKEEIPPSQEELDEKKNIGSENQEGDTSLNVMIEDAPKGNQVVEDAGDDEVYASVEEPAEFPGGTAAMSKFINKHFVYPPGAVRKDIQGKVHVYFEVDKAGKVSNVRIMKGIDKECDEEALRLVKMFPDWKPAKMNGRTVKQKMTVPIKFTLSE